LRNPFRGMFRREQEQRAIGPDSVSFPSASLADPAALSVDGALRLAPVFAAGRLLASSVSSLPLQRYRKSGDRSEKLSQSPLFKNPAAVGTYRDWIFRSMTSLAYQGNAVGIVWERDALEYPTKIEWLNPADVWVDDSMPLGKPGSPTDPVWHWRDVRLPREDVVHIPWFTLPGRVWGLTPLQAFAVTTSTGLAAQSFSDDWFKAGGRPPGRFKNTNQTMTPTEVQAIKARLVSAIRSHEPLVYGADWDYEPITVSPDDAKFVDIMRLTASQIASIYGVPPEMIGGETGGSYTYSSPEQRQIEFVQFALLPWLTTLEEAFNRLLPRGQYVKFNADAIIRVDIRTRYQTYLQARQMGKNSIDEIREFEDEAPLPNGQGTDYTPLQKLSAPEAGSEGDDDEQA
jgi:HK97 family phage portal protein